MDKGGSGDEPDLQRLLPQRLEQKVPAIPLEFEYYPVELLSKQFTKLNSNHPYRVIFLGPRPLNTLALHKRYGRGDNEDPQGQEGALNGVLDFPRYRVNLRKITNCYFNAGRASNSHYKSAIFYRAFEGMNPTIPLGQEYLFRSAFESGNLDCVIKVGRKQFDLFLRIDSNTRGHTAWFYFSVSNGHKLETITLNICNLTKPSTLYEQGMKPFVFSKKAWLKTQVDWSQNISECSFQPKDLRYEVVYENTTIPSSFRLGFEYTFEHEDDEVFFAYCVPYTYSQLQNDITKYQESPYVKVSSIGKSLSGLEMPILHITNHESSERKQERKRKNIVVTGRVHPGESNGSHVLRGFIEMLLGSSKEAQQLRNRVNFFIVPMLNPDGVILGNTRSSIAGKDLNREFMSGKKEIYPQMFAVKTFTARLQRKYGVLMYIDFHGHSQRKNTFLYGPNYSLSQQQYYKCRIFPKIIQKLDPRFRFYSCSFMISDAKRTTARAVMLNQLKIPYSYTVQSSLGMFYHPVNMKSFPFDEKLWKEMGQNIAQGLQGFLCAMLELETLIRERKALRQRQKEQRTAVAAQRAARAKQDQLDILLKGKKGNIYLDILQQVKQSCVPRNFDEQVDSDDHDEQEDMQTHKMRQFTSGVIREKQKQKMNVATTSNNLILEEDQDFEILTPAAPLEDEELTIFDRSPYAEKPKKAFSLNRHTGEENVVKKRQFKSISHIKAAQPVDVRKSEGRMTGASKKREKNFIEQNKTKYTLATKNLFPVQDKCQILSLPRNIQTLRRDMKKGRALIHNMEESRHREVGWIDSRETPLKKQLRIPPSFVKSESVRPYGTSRSRCEVFQEDTVLDPKLRKSLRNLQGGREYLTLRGMQVDNMAMTITAFRSHR